MLIPPPDINGIIRLAGPLNIYATEPLAEELLGHLASHPVLALDLSEVDACDVAGLQLLCAAAKSAHGRKLEFRIVAASPAVSEACAAAGLPLESLIDPQA